MRQRRIPALLLASLVLVLAGCGGEDDGEAGSATTDTASAASVAPESALAFISINADLESEQWEAANALVDKFPGRNQLVDMIESELSEEDLDYARDIDPAIGPEVAIVVLGTDDEVVVLTQPDDEAKLDALLAKADEPTVKEEIDGWTAIAETQARLDAFKTARDAGTLADSETFTAAVGELPDQALVKVYAAGAELTEAFEEAGAGTSLGGGRLISIAAAVEAVDDGFKLGGLFKSEGAKGGEPYAPKLLELIPSGALAVLSFNNLAQAVDQVESNQMFRQFLPQVEQGLGVSLQELSGLFAGESAVYMRQGSPIPEVTMLLDVDDEQAALATLDKLATRVAGLVGGGQPGSADVGGVATKFIQVQGVRVSYAAFDGMVVVTSGATAIQDLRSDDSKLDDDDAFKRAKEATGFEDETSGFFYVNLAQSIPLIQGFAGLAGEDIPPEVSSNLDPLDTLLIQTSRDGDDFRFTGFFGLK
jgi:hypothetical protein